ncbi:hypothetical protein SUGI_1038170 [Cryptomeria japonica]|uniref:FHA domain-containing protein FHA2 n=1 Tax=Cryptomeria japonica TaxID=3369 RepID=UPI002414BD9D|nr:FHA domain-containing protein FHA2 [Cryptomeria japonica]GLJ49194.1 hypothetical protein SUGI_1038170 [Cryptomeria japonica]
MADLEAGFAKLQGEDFEYYMQTYSITLGRNSKKSSVDVDLASLGGGMNISRQHARIFYDFDRRRFALEVLGKNGCIVEGVLYLPGHPPVKLDSQDQLQMGDKKFYFLLPCRNLLKPPAMFPGGSFAPHGSMAAAKKRSGRPKSGDDDENNHKKSRKAQGGNINNNTVEIGRPMSTNVWPSSHHEIVTYNTLPTGATGRQGYGAYQLDQKVDTRRRMDHETDSSQQIQAEEKDVVSAVATVLSDLCGPGEWMPMAKLHGELLEHFSGVWHQNRIRKFLTADDWPASESKGRPWVGLLALLRKYPEHFVINTRSKGRMTAEFVSLVSLLS